MTDYYKRLEVEASADKQQIKRAYYSLIRKYPADRFPSEYKEIQEAYDILSNKESKAEYDQVISLGSEAAFLYREAQKAEEKRDVDRAAEIYHQILGMHPKATFIQGKYAKMLENLEQYGKAVTLREKIYAKDTGNAQYAKDLALAYEMRGWNKKAEKTYQRALKLDDGDAECWCQYVMFTLDQEDFNKAGEILQQAEKALDKKGVPSTRIYMLSLFNNIGYGDDATSEDYLKKINALVRRGSSDFEDVQQFIRTTLLMLEKTGKMQFFHYVTELADMLPHIDDDLRSDLEHTRQSLLIDSLEEKGYSRLFTDLFMLLIDEDADDEEIITEIKGTEFDILRDIQHCRSQIFRLKKEYPQLYQLSAPFFNEVLRTRDVEKMTHQRYKYLSKHYRSLKHRQGDEYDDMEDYDEMDRESPPFSLEAINALLERMESEDMSDGDRAVLDDILEHYDEFQANMISDESDDEMYEWDDDDDFEPPKPEPVRREGPKVGRNDPCPCGSGKKYKKCCGA